MIRRWGNGWCMRGSSSQYTGFAPESSLIDYRSFGAAGLIPSPVDQDPINLPSRRRLWVHAGLSPNFSAVETTTNARGQLSDLDCVALGACVLADRLEAAAANVIWSSGVRSGQARIKQSQAGLCLGNSVLGAPLGILLGVHTHVPKRKAWGEDFVAVLWQLGSGNSPEASSAPV